MSEPSRPHGIFNVAKCVEYLRFVGVEVSDDTAAEWGRSEHVTRFLASTRRPARSGLDMGCRNGHQWYGETERGRRSKARDAANRKATTCPTCGSAANWLTTRWTEARDGSFKDYRPRSERWKPRDQP